MPKQSIPHYTHHDRVPAEMSKKEWRAADKADNEAYERSLGRAWRAGAPDQLESMLRAALLEALHRGELDSAVTFRGRDRIPVAVDIPGVLKLEVDLEFARRARHYDE